MSTTRGLALVSGGGSGIGLAVAEALLRHGWSVSICGRDEARLASASAELARRAADAVQRLLACAADVSRAAEVQAWVAQSRDRFGEPTLLVNNAGIEGEGEIASLSEERWERVLDVNLKGTFLCTREVLPLMRRAGGGWVINIASLAGKRGMPGSSAYCASKFGVVGFTESLLREEVKHGIRATAICPGFVDTPMADGAAVPASEMIPPRDVAATVLYLLDLGPKTVVRELVIERSGAL